MGLQSMTGFARNEGMAGRYSWAWELRSVNGKGLDIRQRLAPGFEMLEADIRTHLSAQLTRGNVQVGLSLSVIDQKMEAVINEDALTAILSLRDRLGPNVVEEGPLTLAALMSIRGLVEFREPAEDEAEMAARRAGILKSLDEAISALVAMRQKEGQALKAVLLQQIERIESLTALIEADPTRQPEEIARRLEAQLSALLGAAPQLERDRLYAEAAILATKADLQEEIDRLKAHVKAARQLLDEGGPVGRKLDFLAQEFNRESNTICSKSNSAAVTGAGIELKVVIDQFREQVQNLE